MKSEPFEGDFFTRPIIMCERYCTLSKPTNQGKTSCFKVGVPKYLTSDDFFIVQVLASSGR